MIATTSNPAAARSCAIPTRHECPETSSGSIPCRRSAEAARQASFYSTAFTLPACSPAPTRPVTCTERKSGPSVMRAARSQARRAA